MLDDFGQRIRDIILSEMDLSRELSDEEICDLIGSVVSREARDRPMTIKDRAELERTIFNSLRKLDVLQELVDDRDVTEIMVPMIYSMKKPEESKGSRVIFHRKRSWRM